MAVLAFLVTPAACGVDEQPDPGAEAADGVAAVVAQRMRIEPDAVAVVCPDDLPEDPGTRFACSVEVPGGEPVEVDLVIGDAGTVELLRAVVPAAAAEDYLRSELAGPAEGPVEVDCGDAPLLVADVGDELGCEVVRTTDGALRSVTITVLGLDGTVRYRVEATDTAPGTTAPTTTVP